MCIYIDRFVWENSVPGQVLKEALLILKQGGRLGYVAAATLGHAEMPQKTAC